MAAVHHLLLGHGLATAAMRAARPDLQIGLVLNPAPVVRPRGGQSRRSSVGSTGSATGWFLDAVLNGAYPADVLEDLAGPIRDVVADGDMATIAAPLDWLGVNYYHDLVLAPGTDPDGALAVPVRGAGALGRRHRGRHRPAAGR